MNSGKIIIIILSSIIVILIISLIYFIFLNVKQNIYIKNQKNQCDFDITKLVNSCTQNKNSLCIYTIDSPKTKLYLDIKENNQIQLRIPIIKYTSPLIDTSTLKSENLSDTIFTIYGNKIVFFKYPFIENTIGIKNLSNANDPRRLCLNLDQNLIFISGPTEPTTLKI